MGVYAATARFPAFRHLTLPLKAFLVTSAGTFAGKKESVSLTLEGDPRGDIRSWLRWNIGRYKIYFKVIMVCS